MGARGATRRELEHAGTERGEHLFLVGDWGRSGVERIEVLDHLREGTAVLLIAALHGRRVADAEPEEEPSGMRRRQLRVPSRDVVRLVHPHVEDAGGHDGAGRRVEEPSRIAEHLTAGAARDPQRPVAEPLELRSRVSGFRSYWRKAREGVMSLVLERRASKDEILELYLNDVYLGQRGSFAIHGVAEASRIFFGKDVANITIAEAAVIAGVIQSPASRSPFSNSKRLPLRSSQFEVIPDIASRPRKA